MIGRGEFLIPTMDLDGIRLVIKDSYPVKPVELYPEFEGVRNSVSNKVTGIVTHYEGDRWIWTETGGFLRVYYRVIEDLGDCTIQSPKVVRMDDVEKEVFLSVVENQLKEDGNPEVKEWFVLAKQAAVDQK